MSDLERPDCPLCGAARASEVLRGPFSVVRCSVCAARYTTPRYREPSKLRAPARGASSTRQLAARADAIAELVPRPGSVLDLGAGEGTFLAIMRSRGWEPHGVDLDPAAARVARERHGLSLAVLDIEKDPLPRGPFDAVTLWGTLPLVYRPHALLARAREVLAPGGVLGVGAPDIGNPVARAVGLDLPRRLVHYTPDTLKRLVEWTGFEVLAVERRLIGAETIALFARSPR